MAVTSEPIKHAKGSAIIRQQTLDRARAHFERIVGLLLIAVSIVGSAIALSRGWDTFRADMLAQNALIGGGLQVAATFVEWLYRKKRISIPYGVAFVYDFGTTIAGYGPMLHPGVAALLAAPLGGEAADVAAWLLIVTAAGLLAVLPEGRLIDG